MKSHSYRQRDYGFGQTILTLRTAMNLSQVELSHLLKVSRIAVQCWEVGNSYPKLEHLKHLIELALQFRAFAAGCEEEEIRGLWRAAHQKVLLDEHWLSAVLSHASRMPSSTSSLLVESPAISSPAETTPPNELVVLLATPLPPGQVLKAIDTLHRRSLLECGKQACSLTLHSVVLKYMSEDMRKTQEELLIAPILANLSWIYPERGEVEAHLLALMEQLRQRADSAQGYGPANVVAQIARDLGIANSTLHHWCKVFAEDGELAFPGSGHQKPQEEEIRHLKRELEITKQKCDILKKALDIFSRSQL